MKTIKYDAFQISKNPENNNIMRISRGIHKLTDYMNCIGNIKASNSVENQAHVASCLCMFLSIFSIPLHI